MADFGKRSGGGRRRSERVSALLPVVVTTRMESHAAVLVDVSRTGAQLRGSDLPGEREELFIRIEHLRLFGTVAWSADDRSGVMFETPISQADIARFQRQAPLARFAASSPDDQLALQDWLVGAAR